MTDFPLVMCLLVTYKRTELALRTIRGVQQNIDYPSLDWVIADDGSPAGHVEALVAAIGHEVSVFNAARKGVGVSMNEGARLCLEKADYILWLEDDWEITKPFDLRPCVQFLGLREDVGMVRLGYISPGISATLIAAAGQLWWKLEKGETYTFTGHAALRHRRFIDAYLPYQEGISPGETELYMCGKFNNTVGPTVAVPAWTGIWGVFGHIGGESLNNVRPE